MDRGIPKGTQPYPMTINQGRLIHARIPTLSHSLTHSLTHSHILPHIRILTHAVRHWLFMTILTLFYHCKNVLMYPDGAINTPFQ